MDGSGGSAVANAASVDVELPRQGHGRSPWSLACWLATEGILAAHHLNIPHLSGHTVVPVTSTIVPSIKTNIASSYPAPWQVCWGARRNGSITSA